MLLERFIAGNGASSSQHSQGSREYLENSLATLLTAGLVALNTIPDASLRALEPQQQAMLRSLNDAQAELAGGADDPDVVHSPAHGGRRAYDLSTPNIATKLGLSPTGSPDPDSSSQGLSVSSQSDHGKRRQSSSPGGESLRLGDGEKKAKKIPSKHEADMKWARCTTRMYFSNDAQDLVAQFNSSMESKEVDALRSGSATLAPYLRKAKDHLLRVVGVVHILDLGAELLEAASLPQGVDVRPRHLLRLIETASAMPHKEGRFIATGPSAAEGSPSVGAAHLISAKAVALTTSILTEHLKVVQAIHAVSQTRLAPLLNVPGFFVTSQDAHSLFNSSNDSFTELCKLAMRNDLGVLLELPPCAFPPVCPLWPRSKGPNLSAPTARSDFAHRVKWSKPELAFTAAAELVKTGGHNIVVFVKKPLPSEGALRMASLLSRSGTTAAQYKSTLSTNLADVPKMTNAVEKRLASLGKTALSCVWASKRDDLVRRETPEHPFLHALRETVSNCSSSSFWSGDLDTAHKVIYQLAVLAANATSKGDAKAVELLADPAVPDPEEITLPRPPPGASGDPWALMQ